MHTYTYHMPTALLIGPLAQNAQAFAGYGNRAWIVTGRSSAKNGALAAVTGVLRGLGIEYQIFDRIQENPTLQNIDEAAAEGRAFKPDFIVGIGGGSPMDSAKALSFLAANPALAAQDLYRAGDYRSLPVLAVPTTAGTGSEATPYAVLTLAEQHTKMSIVPQLFPEKAFLDASFMDTLPESSTLSTAVDALSHLIDGYLTPKANFMSDSIAEGALLRFGDCLPELSARSFTPALREKLLILSTLGGLVISQTKTSLPHMLSYFLTCDHQLPHGFACGVFLYEFMRTHPYQDKCRRILSLLGLDGYPALKETLGRIVDKGRHTYTLAELEQYAARIVENPQKMATLHPVLLSYQEILDIYVNSLL